MILNTWKQSETKYVRFDPNNVDHLKAFYSTKFKGKQDPNLRFFLEEPFVDVISMAQHKIAVNHLMQNIKNIDVTY